MDESLQFSEEDIRQQLDLLGYRNIPTAHLAQFAQDLEQLIRNDTESERYTSHDASSISDSGYSVDEPVQLPRSTSSAVPLSESRGLRPATSSAVPLSESRGLRPATYTSKARSSHAMQPTPPGPSSRRTSHPAKHPQPFSHTATPHDADTSEDSTPARGRRLDKKTAMKRKVVRKMNGQSHVFDESITNSESGDHDIVIDRLSHMELRREDRDLVQDETDSTLTETDDASSLVGFLHGLGRRPEISSELYSHRPGRDEDTVYKPHLPRSFIRPDSAPPRITHNKRTDPVSRHEMYRAEWNTHRAPGEKKRNDLRWSIREQMMYKDSVIEPRRSSRVHSRNNYVVPTDKKRQALRWAIRTSLAHKQMPFSTFS